MFCKNKTCNLRHDETNDEENDNSRNQSKEQTPKKKPSAAKSGHFSHVEAASWARKKPPVLALLPLLFQWRKPEKIFGFHLMSTTISIWNILY